MKGNCLLWGKKFHFHHCKLKPYCRWLLATEAKLGSFILPLRTEVGSSFPKKGSGVQIMPFQRGWQLHRFVFMLLLMGWYPKASNTCV